MKKIEMTKILIQVAKEYATKVGLKYNTPHISETEALHGQYQLGVYTPRFIKYSGDFGYSYVKVAIKTQGNPNLAPNPRIDIRNQDGLFLSLIYGTNGSDDGYENFHSSQVTTQEGLDLSIKIRRRITTLVNKKLKE